MKIIGLIGLTLLLASCMGRSLTVHEEYPPRPAGHKIEVWMDTSAPGDLANSVRNAKLGMPPSEAMIIGEIEQYKPTTWGWSGVVRDAQIDARKMGGDGIVVTHRSGSLFTSHSVRIFVFRLPDAKARKKAG